MQGRYFIVGGAGFIGSHFCDTLLSEADTGHVTVYDSFQSGKEWHISHHRANPRFSVIRGLVEDIDLLAECMSGHDVVIHLASNPDIARAAVDPEIDFKAGTLLTNNVVEAMRRAKTPRKILYASGSGVYGDTGEVEAHEDYVPMTPISTYGASKLAGEALISAYTYMFDMKGISYRFGNVVGPRQTHGVGFDFVRKLSHNPRELHILGDGRQLKSYIAVSDVVNAVLHAHKTTSDRYSYFNVATGDYVTVTEIAELACQAMGLEPRQVKFVYAGGDRGWKGDVPIVRLKLDRIAATGWVCRQPTRVALQESLAALARELKEHSNDS
ncbi:MAG: NAD-dependent epimerase/dehydratase family protein [Hyphomicrobiales bacterium]|nr:MAG: NAD-dependent epimerase/dehydratase family protein [Hyphomicrobiales bacterium]